MTQRHQVLEFIENYFAYARFELGLFRYAERYLRTLQSQKRWSTRFWAKLRLVFEFLIFQASDWLSKMFALIWQIKNQCKTDLKETESFARSEQCALLELFQFIETYDSKKVQDQIFCQNGNIFIQQMFENFNRWKKQLTGKIYRIGCCTLRFVYFRWCNLIGWKRCTNLNLARRRYAKKSWVLSNQMFNR